MGRWVGETLFPVGLKWMAQFVAKARRLHGHDRPLGFVLFIRVCAEEHLSGHADCPLLLFVSVWDEQSSRHPHTCLGDQISQMLPVVTLSQRFSRLALNCAMLTF